MNDPMPGFCDSPPPNEAMSVELARALAEAADGYVGHGPRVFLVCPYRPEEKVFAGGFRVSGPYGDWKEVPDALKCQVYNKEAGFFGPFDLSFVPIVRGPSVSDVYLRIQNPPEAFHVSMDHVDAMFFSTRAVEKFAQPYYERIFGPDFAKQVMTQFQNADVQVMTHFPWTEYVDGTRLMNVPTVLRWDRAEGARLVPVHEGVPPIPLTRARVPVED